MASSVFGNCYGIGDVDDGVNSNINLGDHDIYSEVTSRVLVLPYSLLFVLLG